MKFGLVPKDNVLKFVTLCVVAHNKTFVILSTLVHDLTEEFKGGKGGSVILIDTLTVIEIRLTQDEHVVNIGTQYGWYTKWVLHCDEEEHLHPATVQEQIANIQVACPGIVIETVIQDKE